MEILQRSRVRSGALLAAAAFACTLLAPVAAAGRTGRRTPEEREARRLARREASAGQPSGGEGAASASEPAGGAHGALLEGCQLTLEAEPGVVAAGESVVLRGALSCPEGPPAAGEPLAVYQHVAGTRGMSLAGGATTEADGSYRFTTAAVAADSAFVVRDGALRSPRVQVKVGRRVTIGASVPDHADLLIGGQRGLSEAARGNVVTFSGTVSPAAAGATVALQRSDANGGEDWHRIALGTVAADGAYSITHAFGSPGLANVRVVVRTRDGLAPSASEALTFDIERAPHRRLTIASSSDPDVSGGQITISGTLTAASGQTVTLLARMRGGTFAPVATATTGGDGEYSFKQAPTQSSTYRVTGAGTSSATLFEAVAFGVTAKPSATSVQTGQQLTVSGTLTPAETGHPVYLEARDPSGVGFHVIEAGSVEAGGGYSIGYVFDAAGSQSLRVQVPGESGLQGAASEAFDVSVTAPPAP